MSSSIWCNAFFCKFVKVLKENAASAFRVWKWNRTFYQNFGMCPPDYKDFLDFHEQRREQLKYLIHRHDLIPAGL